MVYLIDSVADMNYNYLYLDEKSISYNELLAKFVLSDDESLPNKDRDDEPTPARSRGYTRANVTKDSANPDDHHNSNYQSEFSQNSHPYINEKNKDHYYNVINF